MTDRDKSILEYSEKMCEYCCNFDKEHIGMDGTALCELTMTLAYAEDYGGNCMFYNVPKEQIIVPPCKVGSMVWVITSKTSDNKNFYIFIDTITHYRIVDGCTIMCFEKHLGVPQWNWDKVFLTKEEAEAKLKEVQG